MARFGSFSGSGIGFGLTMTLNDGFTGPSNRIRRGMAGLEAATDELTLVMNNNFGRIMSGISMVAAGFATLMPLNYVYKEAARYEQLTIAFNTLTGSAANAVKLLGQINDFASTTPFSLIQTEDAVKHLLAFSIPLNEVMADMKALGDITAAFGDKNKMGRLILAFGQVRAAGHLKGGEVRQFREIGINIADLLRKTGTAVDESVDISDQMISFEDVRKAIRAATNEGGLYHDMMLKLSATASGMWSNIGDEAERMARAFGESLVPIMKSLYSVMLPFMASLREFFRTTAGKIVAAVITLSALLVGLGLIIVGLTMLFTALAPAIKAGVAVLYQAIPVITGFLGPVLLTVAAIVALRKTLSSNNSAIFGFGVALAFAMGPLAQVAALIFVLVRSWNEFQRALNDPLELRLGGLLGMLQRIGAVLYSLYYGFKYATSENFYLPVELVDMLKSMGIYEFVIDLLTWAIRVKEFFRGIIEGVTDFIDAIKEAFQIVLKALEIDTKGHGWLSWLARATSAMERWKTAGYVLGQVLAGVLMTLVAWQLLVIATNPFALMIAGLYVLIFLISKLMNMSLAETLEHWSIGFQKLFYFIKDIVLDIIGPIQVLVGLLQVIAGVHSNNWEQENWGMADIQRGTDKINYSLVDDFNRLDSKQAGIYSKYNALDKMDSKASELGALHDRALTKIQELQKTNYGENPDPKIMKSDSIKIETLKGIAAQTAAELKQVYKQRDNYDSNKEFAESGQASNNPNVVSVELNIDGEQFHKAFVDITKKHEGVQN